jgi:hypothetical protein
MKSRFPALLLATLLLPGALRSQTAARSQTIAGVVLDPSGAAIVGAEVALDRTDGSQLSHTVTDGVGGFQFRSVPYGSYQIDVRQSGFRETKATVVAGNGTRPATRIVMPNLAVDFAEPTPSEIEIRKSCVRTKTHLIARGSEEGRSLCRFQ